jgi:hypothetical protein
VRPIIDRQDSVGAARILFRSSHSTCSVSATQWLAIASKAVFKPWSDADAARFLASFACSRQCSARGEMCNDCCTSSPDSFSRNISKEIQADRVIKLKKTADVAKISQGSTLCID